MGVEHHESQKQTRSKRYRLLFAKLWQNQSIRFSLLLLTPLTLLVILSPILSPHDPTVTHSATYASPSLEFPLGTDNLGRDTLSRVLLGGRTTLFLGISAASLALLLGVPIGLSAGYYGGRTDEFLMRVMDILISIPTLLMALLILIALEPSLVNVIVAVGIIYSPRVARVIRSSTLSVRNDEYVLAAKARGESDLYIMSREIFPNVLSTVVVEGSIRVGYAILVGTSLSFLGLGTQPPHPDWGYMIAIGRDHYWHSIHMIIWPAIAVGITILAFNLLGDGLRDVLDPKSNQSER